MRRSRADKTVDECSEPYGTSWGAPYASSCDTLIVDSNSWASAENYTIPISVLGVPGVVYKDELFSAVGEVRCRSSSTSTTSGSRHGPSSEISVVFCSLVPLSISARRPVLFSATHKATAARKAA